MADDLFKPAVIESFGGGQFRLIRNPATVAELRAWLRAVDAELSGWGDERKLQSVWLDGPKQELDVTLAEPIPQ